MSVLLKLLFVLVMAILPAVPFLLEYSSFRRDAAKNSASRRFWRVIFAAGYIVLMTVLLAFLDRAVAWLGSLSFVQRLAAWLAIGGRAVYVARVIIVLFVNFLIGVLYWMSGRAVLQAACRRSPFEPGKNGKFTFAQKAEQKAVRHFYSRRYFFFGKILKYLSIFLSVYYLVYFVAIQLPGVFGASRLPYEFLSDLLAAGYLYPTLALIGLWELTFFFRGLERLEKECPAYRGTEGKTLNADPASIEDIDKKLKEAFADYYACDVCCETGPEVASSSRGEIAGLIAKAVENDPRNRRELHDLYCGAIDGLTKDNKSILINGSFFSDFSGYFLRYLSAVLARGDTVIVVCSSDAEIESVFSYLKEGFSEISSLYCAGGSMKADAFDFPVWRIVKVCGERGEMSEAFVEDCSVLVTSLAYLESERFDGAYSSFFSHIDAVVFVDTLSIVNKFRRQLAALHTRLVHLVRRNDSYARNGTGETRRLPNKSKEMRYASRSVRYICFDDSRIPGLDRVLSNLLGVELDTADAMYYGKGTAVRCYLLDGKPGPDGRIACPQFIKTKEEIGVVMNMALLCLAAGASNVTVFADDLIPYANYMETIVSNEGGISFRIGEGRLTINRCYYDACRYSVVIAVDSDDNLPAAVRRYLAMLSDSTALLILFSRPYMLREFYLSRIDHIWRSNQIELIPVEEWAHGSAMQARRRADVSSSDGDNSFKDADIKKEIGRRVVTKASEGGIFRSEILRLARDVPQYAENVERGEFDLILKDVLDALGASKEATENLFKYFEYRTIQGFDEAGKVRSDVRVTLRREGKLYRSLRERRMTILCVGESEYVLPLPCSRLTQNYIARQNLIYNGQIYFIEGLDARSGKLYARRASGGGNNEVFSYIQKREYRLDADAETREYLYPVRHVIIEKADGRELQTFVSVFRAPMEVLTHGYYEVDPHTYARNRGLNRYHSLDDPTQLAVAMQVYRRYGAVSSPAYSSYQVMRSGSLLSYAQGATVMAIRICGSFVGDLKKTAQLAAVMLGEQLRSMFPSVAEAVAVCCVSRGEFAGKDAETVFCKLPALTLMNGSLGEESELCLLIIEDCPTDLGVISGLMSSGDNILMKLFGPVYEYLGWYKEHTPSESYLHFGLGRQPDCFDFDGLYDLASLLGDDGHDIALRDEGTVVAYETCDLCGRRFVRGDGIFARENGRKICKFCAEELVVNDEKTLKNYVDRAKSFLESVYGVNFGEDVKVCFESLVKIVNALKRAEGISRRGAGISLFSYVDGEKIIHAENSLPARNLTEMLVRELTHLWELSNLPGLDDEYAEGLIALVSVQFLKFARENSLAAVRASYYESDDGIAGEGYRKLLHELLLDPESRSNPFYYLQKRAGGENVSRQSVRIGTCPESLGIPYAPELPDRAKEGELRYFYRERLSAEEQAFYDTMLAAIATHEGSVSSDGRGMKEIHKISDAILYDHPELFFYRTFALAGDKVILKYGATKEEAAQLQRRIDAAVPQFLQGINDEMSAYDAALRIYLGVIDAVDYDRVGLANEKKEGGSATDKIDYLRSICGVFLNGKAVCEGYARAVQYLMQKCGIECAEAAGNIRGNEEENSAHAWNIVKIDGDYYHLDATWGDCADALDALQNDGDRFSYFCITSEEIGRTRDFSLSPVALPDCTATRANYFCHNGLVLERCDPEAIKRIAVDAAAQKSSFFMMKCSEQRVFEEVLKQLSDNDSICFDALKFAEKSDARIRSDTFLYSYNEQLRTIRVRFKYKQGS